MAQANRLQFVEQNMEKGIDCEAHRRRMIYFLTSMVTRNSQFVKLLDSRRRHLKTRKAIVTYIFITK